MVTASQYQLKDTFIESSVEETVVSGSVSAGNSEITTVTAANGEVWSVVAVAIFVPADADATSGFHEARFGPNSGPARALLNMESNFDTAIDLTFKRIKSGSLTESDYSFYESQQKASQVLIDDTTGVDFAYENQLGVAQENDRDYKIVVNKFEA